MSEDSRRYPLDMRTAQRECEHVTKRRPAPVERIDPLLIAWGRGIRYLRLHCNEHGEKLGDEDEPMTQGQMGQRLDPPVEQPTVARWEAGHREPRRRYKKQISDLFGVTVETIFADDPDKCGLAKQPMPTRNRKAVA